MWAGFFPTFCWWALFPVHIQRMFPKSTWTEQGKEALPGCSLIFCNYWFQLLPKILSFTEKEREIINQNFLNTVNWKGKRNRFTVLACPVTPEPALLQANSYSKSPLSVQNCSLSKSPDPLKNKVQKPLPDPTGNVWNHTSPLAPSLNWRGIFEAWSVQVFFFFFLQTFFTREDHMENWPLVMYFSPWAPEPSGVKLFHLILKLIFISCKMLQVCTRMSLSSWISVCA